MKNWIIFFGVVLSGLFIVSGIAYLVSQKDESRVYEEDHKNELQAETSGSNYTIETIPIPNLQDLMPDLNREVQYSSTVPEDAKAILENNINETRGHLLEDPTRGGDWLDLGLSYHTAGDYEGARLIWEFLIIADPNNSVAFENLAKLHHFQIPNYPKSELLFRRVMEIDPNSITPYFGLYELYRYTYKKETTAAVDILKEAMVKFPEEISLYVALGGYYRDIGQIMLARQTFLEGLDKARNANNLDLITVFGTELDRVQ